MYVEAGKALPKGVKRRFLEQAPEGDRVYVLYVVDGDTIAVTFRGGVEMVRLIRVDTPGVAHPDYSDEPAQPYSEEAKEFTEDTINETEVVMTYEGDEPEWDKYDRLLAYIWLPDGTLFNKLLIEEGYARYYPWFTFKFEEDFKEAEREAKLARRGMWSLPLML